MNITDKFTRATDSSTGRPIIATLAAPGKTVGAPSITLSRSTNWTTSTPVYIALYLVTSAGIKDPTTQTDWKATLSGTTLSNLTLTGGTDCPYPAGAYVEITYTAAWAKDLYDGLATSFNADGSLKTTAVQNALNLGTTNLNGWNPLGYTPAVVTYNGNRSYSLQFNGVDLTSAISNGMRLLLTRTVAAPTQCTNLNGTSQYYSKTSPAGSAQTDTMTFGGHIKPSAYQAGGIISQTSTPGTNGWQLTLNASGQVVVTGGARSANSYQSVPLNKWSHVAATISMSGSTAQIYIDGIAVPTTALSGSGASWTSAGSLNIGAVNGGTFFAGKIAQAFAASVNLSATQIKAIYSQGFVAGDVATYSLVSAYSFNNTVNDINTTNANNLTANGSAVATNTDAPWTQQDTSVPNGTTDYAIITSKTFSTNTTITVQVPEGCTIPTSGGITNVQYSGLRTPFGFPAQREKWSIQQITIARQSSAATTGNWVNMGHQLTVPVGEWRWLFQGSGIVTSSSIAYLAFYIGLSVTNNGQTDKTLAWQSPSSNNAATQQNGDFYREGYFSLSAQTTYYLNALALTGGTGLTLYIGDNSAVGVAVMLKAECAYL